MTYLTRYKGKGASNWLYFQLNIKQFFYFTFLSLIWSNLYSIYYLFLIINQQHIVMHKNMHILNTIKSGIIFQERVHYLYQFKTVTTCITLLSTKLQTMQKPGLSIICHKVYHFMKKYGCLAFSTTL